jgi:hypothetical protein
MGRMDRERNLAMAPDEVKKIVEGVVRKRRGGYFKV